MAATGKRHLSSPSRPALGAVVFDWGGTICPWYPIDSAAECRAYADAYGDPALGPKLSAACDRAWALSRDRQVSSRLLDILDRLRLRDDPGRHRAGMAAYNAFWDPHTMTRPEVRPVLERLRERDIAIGLLSNTLWDRDRHEDILRRDGVLDLFDACVFTSEIGFTKPSAAAFQAVLSALDAHPRDTIFVGDRLYDDIYGANRAGLRTIFLAQSDIPPEQVGVGAAEPDIVVSDFGEIAAAIDRLWSTMFRLLDFWVSELDCDR